MERTKFYKFMDAIESNLTAFWTIVGSTILIAILSLISWGFMSQQYRDQAERDYDLQMTKIGYEYHTSGWYKIR